MVTDWEAAWLELADRIARKSQHGRDVLLRDMALIAANHRVVAGELSRLLRLYGVEVERVRSVAAERDRDGAADFAGGFGSSAERGSPEHHRPGGHDVRAGAGSNGRAR